MGDGDRRYGLGLRHDAHLVLVTALTTLLLTVAAYGAWEIVWIFRFVSAVVAEQTVLQTALAADRAKHAQLYAHAGPVPKLDHFFPVSMRYPPIAVRNGQQGIVLLDVLVRPDGVVGDATVAKSSGSAQLDAAAITQVGYWRFVPAKENGRWIAKNKKFRIVFKLSDAQLPIGRAPLPPARP
jgi:TonB family protein